MIPVCPESALPDSHLEKNMLIATQAYAPASLRKNLKAGTHRTHPQTTTQWQA